METEKVLKQIKNNNIFNIRLSWFWIYKLILLFLFSLTYIFIFQADSEEGNEMVLCAYCNIYVHQLCYGITSIPQGPWLCATCKGCTRPKCVLCPNKGGAMKCTKSGQKWAHVICVLWIPEVSFGCFDQMEHITGISNIPVHYRSFFFSF